MCRALLNIQNGGTLDNSFEIINPLTANHNNCHLLCHLLVILKVISANSVDPDQTASDQGPHCLLYAKIGLKSLQEYSADDINRRIFRCRFSWHFKLRVKSLCSLNNRNHKFQPYHGKVDHWGTKVQNS